MEEVGASLWLHYLDLSRICPPGVRSIRYQHIFCILIPELTTYCLLRNIKNFSRSRILWTFVELLILDDSNTRPSSPPSHSISTWNGWLIEFLLFSIFYFFIHRDPWFCTCEGGRQTKGQRQSQTRAQPQQKRQIHGQYQEKIEKQGKRLDTNTKAWTNTRPLYL